MVAGSGTYASPACMRIVPVVEPERPARGPPGWPTKSMRYVMSKKLSTFQLPGPNLRQRRVARARQAEIRTGGDAQQVEVGIAGWHLPLNFLSSL